MFILLIIIIILYYYITLNLNTNNILHTHNINYNINKYNCTLLLKQPLLNTIITDRFYYYFKHKYIELFYNNAEREQINYNNADFLLQWYPNKNTIKHNNNPIIIFANTIQCNGALNSFHYYFMLYLYKKRKYNIVHIDFRGYTFNLHDYKSFYDTGLDDTNHIINYITSQFPEKHLYLCGFSLGGVLFTNVLHKYNIPNIKGLILVSAPATIAGVLQQSNNTFFNYPEKILMYFVRSYFTKHKIILDHPHLTKKNKKNILNMDTFNEFFTNYMKPINNNKYNIISDWSNDIDIINQLKNIKIPVLMIHSRDDYIYSYTDDALKILSNNKNISYIITKYGGHDGFLNKNYKLFYSNPILNFIISTENKI